MILVRELRDVEAVLVAVIAAMATFGVTQDWRAGIGAGIGTIAVRIAVGLRLSADRGIPSTRLPGLTDKESSVAHCIQRGLHDPAIASILGISLPRVHGRVLRIEKKWGLTSREQIATRVAQIGNRAHIDPSPKQRWEWIAELGTGIAVMALGIGVLTLPPDVPGLGPIHDALGLVLLLAGLLFGAVSTVFYFSERIHPG
jgi:DNA-binding CsgD family transcriptional regulator